ncbi:MAG TPA: glycosyltransferase family 39 protein [Prolixibacteraceae bacterium]|nr:glycosyltransferase family 39 protein [Prolixibacteraceae bacterium]
MNSSKTKLFFGKYWILILLVAVKLILQFVLVNPVYELHRDEFLHLDQAFHPAAGYISVPPFSSWIASLIYLFGGGIFWIRFFPAFFGALTIVFAWLIAEEIGGRLASKILVSVLLIFSVLARLNVLFQPNSFDILAWTIVFYFLIRYINTPQTKWLLLLAGIIALGLYNKYNILFLIAGLFAGLLLTPQRTIFTKKAFYITIALGLILFLPNIIWQIKNHFPVIHHMEALGRSQLVNINRIDFLMDQLKFGLIGIITLAAFWGLAFYKPFKSWRFIGWTFITVITLYTLSRGKSYYAIGLYPVLFAFGSVYLEAILKKWKIIFIPILAVIQIVVFLSIAKFLMPVQSPSEIITNHETYEKMGLLHWEDGENHPLPQDFADMLGWREMADKALVAYQTIQASEVKNTLIFCDNYGQTGALNYYNRGKMPEAYSFNTDYIYWIPTQNQIQNMLLVGNKPSQKIIDLFTAIKLVGVVENEFAREKGTEIYLLTGAKPEVSGMINKMAADRISKFDIF